MISPRSVWMLLAALVLAVAFAGCSEPEGSRDEGTEESAVTTDTNEDAGVADTTGSEDGDLQVAVYSNDDGEAVCPVMGGVVKDTSEAVSYFDHEGQRFYFCCDGCPDAFKADPDAYLSPSEEESVE